MQTRSFRPLPRLDGAKVLIVDDEADIRDSLNFFFNVLGAEVKQAASGQEGLRQWAEWDPTVVVSDISMPGLNGYQFMQALRTAERLQGSRHTPAIAVSAHSDEDDIASAKLAGFDMHLAKPADPNELAYLVKGCCEWGQID
jgi:CheY-like chemotaxis protein